MIRKADVQDIESIVLLEEKIFGHSLGYAFLKQELLENPFSKIYVSTINQEVIGYISYRVVDKNADIINFLIDQPFWHQGYGKELFDFIYEELKRDAVETIILEVRKSNDRAIKFYQKYGAIMVRTIKNYYITEDAIVLLLEVK